jgi:cytochrome P450
MSSDQDERDTPRLLGATLDEELDSFLRGDAATISWPYSMFQRLRENHPIYYYDAGPATVLTRYRDVKAIISDAERISNDGYRHGPLAQRTLEKLPVEDHPLFHQVMDFEGTYISRTDGDQHARLRRIAGRLFTPRRIAVLRDSVEAHVNDLLDAGRDGDAIDIKASVANRLPVRIVSELIGVPSADREMIFGWAEQIANHFSLDSATLHGAHAAIENFKAYVHDLIATLRRSNGSDSTDIALALLDARDGESLTEEEMVAMFVLLLWAGSETTTNLLGNGTLALLRHRSEWQKVCDDPIRAKDAVEEALRYDSPLQYLPRVATAPINLEGHLVEEGQTIIVVIGAANRDPEIFDLPTVFDIDRPNKSAHLALSFGAHFCLGAVLARLEGEMVFGTLARRFPNAQLAGDDVVIEGSAMLRRIRSLPVVLGAERS